MSLLKLAPIVASISALALALIKFIVGLNSGSVAVLASAIDSLLDFVISFFNYLVLKKSLKAPNQKYNFGFSKLEALAGFMEGLVIVGIGSFIFYQSIEKIQDQERIMALNSAIFVMLFSLFITLALILFLNFVAKKTNSLLIKTDALHYKIDFLTNLATLVVLVLVYFSDFWLLDAIFGIIISLYICFCALKIIKDSATYLLDVAISEEELEIIINIFKAYNLNYHALKTRRTPHTIYISVHLVFDEEISLYKAHQLSDEVEEALENALSDELLDISIHLDPYDDSYKLKDNFENKA